MLHILHACVAEAKCCLCGCHGIILLTMTVSYFWDRSFVSCWLLWKWNWKPCFPVCCCQLSAWWRTGKFVTDSVQCDAHRVVNRWLTFVLGSCSLLWNNAM